MQHATHARNLRARLAAALFARIHSAGTQVHAVRRAPVLFAASPVAASTRAHWLPAGMTQAFRAAHCAWCCAATVMRPPRRRDGALLPSCPAARPSVRWAERAQVNWSNLDRRAARVTRAPAPSSAIPFARFLRASALRHIAPPPCAAYVHSFVSVPSPSRPPLQPGCAPALYVVCCAHAHSDQQTQQHAARARVARAAAAVQVEWGDIIGDIGLPTGPDAGSVMERVMASTVAVGTNQGK
jgi:hypothetical protein